MLKVFVLSDLTASRNISNCFTLLDQVFIHSMMPQSESHIKNWLDHIRCAKCSMPSASMDFCEKGKYKYLQETACCDGLVPSHPFRTFSYAFCIRKGENFYCYYELGHTLHICHLFHIYFVKKASAVSFRIGSSQSCKVLLFLWLIAHSRELAAPLLYATWEFFMLFWASFFQVSSMYKVGWELIILIKMRINQPIHF